MGYTTDFYGEFALDRKLASAHFDYLEQFSNTRHMKRDFEKVSQLEDECRGKVGLPIGPEGAYFVAGAGMAGQGHDPSIIDYNYPPETQPGLWCQWVPNEDGTAICWDGGEKFYNYIEWIEYLIEHFLGPWGYKLNGEVSWEGEDSGDVGKISITDNKVVVHKGRVVYDVIED